MVDDALLSVRALKKHFRTGRGRGVVKAVDGVSFRLGKCETLGLVGESGSGKTTAGRALLRLIEPTAGVVEFDGRNILELRAGELRRLRRRAQIVFQDPYGSLNPRMTVGATLREVLAVHRLATGRAADERISELLSLVGLGADHRDRYPHEFSGGQRQRIGIARALAVQPEFIVCDEPVSALDVSVQAQVLNLLRDLQDRFALSYLFIAHDLSVVEFMSDRIAVMYLGRIVELAPTAALVRSPRHPYTRALLEAVPVPRPRVHPRRITLPGDLPERPVTSGGCPFRSRCVHPAKDDACAHVLPILEEKAAGHFAACIKEPAGPGQTTPA